MVRFWNLAAVFPNILTIKKLMKSDFWNIELEDGSMLSVSRRKKTEFKELIDKYVDISLEKKFQ